MVRLKRKLLLRPLSDLTNFNSNMVRLKQFAWLPVRVGEFNFNSNMVRLKPRSHLFLTGYSEFQFQHGTIKAVLLHQ